MKNIVPIIVGVVILGAVGIWYWTSSNQMPTTNTPASATVLTSYDLTLTKRVLSPNIVTVTEGDQLTVKVISDESGEFHVSGYEIENDMTAGTQLSFSFTADKAGRYNFELHPKVEGASAGEHDATTTDENTNAEQEDIVIGAFVVNPK